MEKSNGIGRHVNGKGATGTSGVPPHQPEQAPLTCPACGSPVSKELYDRILRLDEARGAEFAEELEALGREREEINLRRAEIAEEAAAEESAKWEVEAQRVARDIARLQKEATTQQAKADQAHKKEMKTVMLTLAKMQADVAKADAKAKAEVAKAQASAATEAAALVKDAKREAEDAQRAEVDSLRSELKTVEQRRQREENALKKTIVDMKRRAEARDRGHLGIEGEEGLIEMLKGEFPIDLVEHHGVGGDVVHRVMDNGKTIATIVYECKNRNGWEGSWVKQTLAAMETHKTVHGLLVTRCLPARKSGMAIIDGVIVAEPAIAVQIVAVLRSGIVAIARLEASETDKASKAAALVKYLRGDEFTGAMARVSTKVGQLVSSLSRERSSHDGWWRTRELAYASVLREVAGVDGRVAELLGGPANDNAKKMEKVR